MHTIILDRDGVINQDSSAYIKSPDEWIPIPGSLEAIASLSRSGLRILVATNQSGLGRGYYDLATLGRIHAKMCSSVTSRGGRIEAIFFCPHAPGAHCSCRKPAPGLIEAAIRRYGLAAQETIVVGDSLRDVQAARAAGTRPVLVQTGNGRATLTHAAPDLWDIPVYSNLLHFAEDYSIPSDPPLALG